MTGDFVSPQEAGLKIGDIFCSSWGYDQTNVDFYQVVGMTNMRVRLAPMLKRWAGDGSGVVPTKINPDAGILTKAVYPGGNPGGWADLSPSVSISKSQSAYLWDGKPERETYDR